MTIYVVVKIKTFKAVTGDTGYNIELVPRLKFSEAMDVLKAVSHDGCYLDIIKCDMPVAESVFLSLYEAKRGS